MDLVYIHPGGVRTGIAFFYFDKVSFMKHPTVQCENANTNGNYELHSEIHLHMLESSLSFFMGAKNACL